MPQLNIAIDEHYAVGPVTTDPEDEHATLMVSGDYPGTSDGATETQVFVCVTCGLVTDDQRRFQVTGCDREKNDINRTLGEAFGIMEAADGE